MIKKTVRKKTTAAKTTPTPFFKPVGATTSAAKTTAQSKAKKTTATKTATDTKSPHIMAVLDIGSNATRMLVGEINSDGVFVRHLFTRVPIALGLASYGADRTIPPAVQRRLILALQGLQKIAAAMQASKLHAVATAAVRDCQNRRQLLINIRRHTDIDITVLSGDEEAAIVGAFVARQFPPAATVLNTDTGGGSTDCAIIRRGDIIANATFALGAARKNGGGAGEKNNITAWLKQHCPPNIIAVSSGGGARKLSALCAGITAKKLTTFLHAAGSLSSSQRAVKFNLTPDRARNIIPAAHICRHILISCGAKKMHTIDGGLGEAVLVQILTDKK